MPNPATTVALGATALAGAAYLATHNKKHSDITEPHASVADFSSHATALPATGAAIPANDLKPYQVRYRPPASASADSQTVQSAGATSAADDDMSSYSLSTDDAWWGA
ncbi:hypothetical protein HDV00_012791 [Rhizophlyctis rosea]|nr:hypothetical protein HDV00_012791 [Rhizophlyctis rosea]